MRKAVDAMVMVDTRNSYGAPGNGRVAPAVRRGRLPRFRAPLVVVLLAMVALVLPLAGCGDNRDEEVIRASATALLDTYKQPTRESLPELVGSDARRTFDQMELYGVDGYAIAERYFRNFDYTIDDVSINGDTATVSLTMRNINVSRAIEDTTSKYSTDKGKEVMEQLFEQGGDGAVYREVFNDLINHLDATTEIVENKTALTLTKTNGSWSIDEKCIPNVVGAIYGNTSVSALLQ